MDCLMSNYKPLDITFTRGEGAWLWDQADERYLDALTGIAVCGLGHAHPAVTQAICEQASQLIHTSNIYHINKQQQLAEKLINISGMSRAFFCNSGAEANEAAIKIARLHGHKNAIQEPKIIVAENSFHGRTMATLTATGNRQVQAGFEPLVSGFLRVPYNDIEAIKQLAKDYQDISAILIEPIQGESGIQIPADDYLIEIRKLCDQNNWLFMLDEIQTGMGRTGHWFAFQQQALLPDVMTLAKGLGNGVPIGACLALGDAAELFQPGHHGSTFGGNPLVCNAALAVINTIEKEQLLSRITQLSDTLLDGFQQTLADLDGVVSIRGKGLMLAIELDRPCTELIAQALDKKLLINVTADNIIRLLPPFILSDEQAQEIINTVSELVRSFLQEE